MLKKFKKSEKTCQKTFVNLALKLKSQSKDHNIRQRYLRNKSLLKQNNVDKM